MMLSPSKALASALLLFCLLSSTRGDMLQFEGMTQITGPLNYHRDHANEDVTYPFRIPAPGEDLLAGDWIDGVNFECVDALLEATQKNSTRAQLERAVDATGKLPSGILIGNPDNLGNYKECHDMIGWHYCLVDVILVNTTTKPLPLNATLRWGFCVPDVCNATDVTNGAYAVVLEGVTRFFPKLREMAKNQLMVTTPYCAIKPPFSAGVIVFTTITALLASFVLIGTLWDAWPAYVRHKKECDGYEPMSNRGMSLQSEDMTEPLMMPDEWNGKANGDELEERPSGLKKFMNCFSLVRNIPRLLSRKAPIENLKVLNGMRTISMTWVLLGHTYLWAITAGVDNPIDVFHAVGRFSMQPVSNGPFFAVDSFFYLSGFLVAYFVFDGLKKKPVFPLLKYYFHRYWRLTPTYAYALFLYSTLAPYFAEGPLWYNMNIVDNNCGKYWWTNILYINNFYPEIIGDTSACMGWTWYLANDMQFFIVSPIFLLLLWKNRRLGLYVSFIALLGSWFVTGVLTWHYDYDASMVHEAFDGAHQKEKTYLNWVYIKPYCRLGPYMVGLLTGWYLSVVVPRRKVYVRRAILWTSWIVAGIIMGSTVYGCYNILHGHVWSRFENMMYITFARTAWAVALAIVTITGYMGHGGIVTKFLGGTIWMPLGRLTYTAYLIHPIVMDTLYYGKDRLTHYEDHVMIYYFAGNLLYAYSLAAIVSMLVEFPTAGLEKLLLAPRRKKRDQGSA